MAHRFDVEVFQDVQHFDDHRTASGQLVRRDLQTSVLAPKRLTCFRLIVGEIRLGQQSAVGLHVRCDFRGNRSGVEIIHPIRGDACQGRTHSRVLVYVAGLARCAVVLHVYRPGRWVATYLLDVRDTSSEFGQVPVVANMWAHQKSVVAVTNWGLHQLT